MHGTFDRRSRRPTVGKLHLPLVAALFCLFTYALFSLRAEIILGDSFQWLTAKRLVATLLGAGMFLSVLHVVGRSDKLSAAKLVAIISTILPASLAVLAARLLLDRFYYGQPLSAGDDVRWVLVWAGYFGLWVSGALALKLHASSKGSLALARLLASQPTTLAQSTATSPATASTDAEAWTWLLDILAREMASVPPPKRLAILDRLMSQAGYECVDELYGSEPKQAARAALVRRLAGRWPE